MSTHLARKHSQLMSARGQLTSVQFTSVDCGCQYIVMVWSRDTPGSQYNMFAFDLCTTINYNSDREGSKVSEACIIIFLRFWYDMLTVCPSMVLQCVYVGYVSVYTNMSLITLHIHRLCCVLGHI
jgi:hypothetical protein